MADAQKHEEFIKTLKKKKIDWKSASQLQTLTFINRKEKIATIKGKNAVTNMLEQYPYLDQQKVVRY